MGGDTMENFIKALTFLAIFWGIYFCIILFIKKIRKKQEKKNFLFERTANIDAMFYEGICPECEGYGKENQPCPLCQGKEKYETQISLKELLKRYPEFFTRHITKIEMDSGKIIFDKF